MKISTRTEYGVRILVTLARSSDDRCQSLAEIARREKLPPAYCEHIIGDLRRAELVTATRGQRGGYRLARPAADIAMADVVRALEGPILEMPCAGTDDFEHCDRPMPCSVHTAFQRVYESLSSSLTATTLAEVAEGTGGPPYPHEVRRRRMAGAARQTGEAQNA